MLRAGLIRQSSAGIYSWLPLGFKVLHKIEQIVREEQDRAGALELLDADHSARRPMEGERPLRGLRQGDASHRGPSRARDALWSDQRGADHRNLPRRGEVLQGAAAHPLSHPMEVPRRDQAAIRRDARARVPDEGFLFLRPDGRGRAQVLQQDVRLLFAHLRPHGAEIGADGRRDGADRRQSQPRVHHPRRHRRERGPLPQGSHRACAARRRHRL